MWGEAISKNFKFLLCSVVLCNTSAVPHWTKYLVSLDITLPESVVLDCSLCEFSEGLVGVHNVGTVISM